METTKEKLIQMCVERGMFESQAAKVVDLAIVEIDAAISNHKTTWDRPVDEYPPKLYGVMFTIVKKCAVKWIEKNLPQAYFKPMFL